MLVRPKRILLIISGGIAAYKTPDLVRRLKGRGYSVRCVLTQGGAKFVSPLTLQAVSEDTVYQDLFSLNDENQMGHIQLSRDADLLVVAPATANIMARMAQGHADDLATTVLLATDKPVMIAPSMNVRMWDHAATRENLQTLTSRGVVVIGPEQGDMACGEVGMGRMSEPLDIAATIDSYLNDGRPLQGKRALVTSGPTFEAIDPVRFIGNRSSGKQGHAIATALAELGAETILVSGPSHQPLPSCVSVVPVESAREMLTACQNELPVDIAVCAAAVSDWRAADAAPNKIKKQVGNAPPTLNLIENPDILATLSAPGDKRPALVVGFAAETEDVIANGVGKLERKGCDWIVANNVSADTGTFDGEFNTVHLITRAGTNDWPQMSKSDVGRRLAQRIAKHVAGDVK